MSEYKEENRAQRFVQLKTFKLWGHLGNAECYAVAVDSQFEGLLKEKLEEANRVRQERRRNRSRHAVIKSLHERGIEIVDGLSGYDRNDVVGLIGEIMVEDLIVDCYLEPILPKWRYTGTSKSKGVDLVARERLESNWKLALYEAKHVHVGMRRAEPKMSQNIIRNEFKKGIDEFEHDKTRLNLANVLIKLGDLIRLGEANGSDVRAAKEHRESISRCLVNDQYRISVIVLVDSKYCDDTTLQHSVSKLSHPLEVGENHFVTLGLLEARDLERATQDIGGKFVGIV